MKKILMAAALLCSAASLQAQQTDSGNRLIIVDANGTEHYYRTADLDEITFDKVEDVEVGVVITGSTTNALQVTVTKPEQVSRYSLAVYPTLRPVDDVAYYVNRHTYREGTESMDLSISGLNSGVDYTVAVVAYDAYDMACGVTTDHRATTAATTATATVGDYLYSDGTWSTTLDAAKTVIGLVFSTEPSATDQAMGYTHGYAIALHDAATRQSWSDVATFEEAPYQLYEDRYVSEELGLFLTDKDGFTETCLLEQNGRKGAHTFPAAEAALSYDVAAPLSTSGWYLPSIGQWYAFCVNFGGMNEQLDAQKTDNTGYWGNQFSNIVPTCVSNINQRFAALAEDAYTPFIKNDYVWYWSSTEYSAQKAYNLSFTDDEWAVDLDSQFKYMQTATGHVRPVIAF